MITSHITKAIIKRNKVRDGIDICPENINEGECFIWALLFYQNYGGSLYTVRYWGGHAFVLHQNKYYDSESPRGIKDWRRLKSFKYKKNIPEGYASKMSLAKFLKYWKITKTLIRSYQKFLK